MPTCSLVVTPSKANLNDPITVDVGGSQNVKSVEVDVYNSQGAKSALTPSRPIHPSGRPLLINQGSTRSRPESST